MMIQSKEIQAKTEVTKRYSSEWLKLAQVACEESRVFHIMGDNIFAAIEDNRCLAKRRNLRHRLLRVIALMGSIK